MKKIAVFGKPGSGKSSFSKALSLQTGLPLHPLDAIAYQANGQLTSRPEFDDKHQRILNSDSWIIDGLGPIDSFYQRLQAADTWVYINLPYWLSYWLVTKRLIKGGVVKPQGWPAGSSVIKGSIQSYKILRRCPQFWNDDLVNRLKAQAEGKNLYIISQLGELALLEKQLAEQINQQQPVRARSKICK